MRWGLFYIGRGDASEVAVRYVRPQPVHASDDDGAGDIPSEVAEIAKAKWATLDEKVRPMHAGHQVLKVSRHLDVRSRLWTWIGLYGGVEFAGHTRSGYYFGAGLCIEEAIPTGDVATLLERQMRHIVAQTFDDAGTRMERSIHWIVPTVEAEDVARALSLEPLGSNHGGLEPKQTRARYVHQVDWSFQQLNGAVQATLRDPDYRPFGGFFFGNEPTAAGREELFLSANYRPEPYQSQPPAATPTPEPFRERFRPDPSPPRPAQERRTGAVAEDPDAGFDQRLHRLEDKFDQFVREYRKGVEASRDRPVPNSWFPATITFLIAGILLVLIAQVVKVYQF
jgi:hypothetical protein